MNISHDELSEIDGGAACPAILLAYNADKLAGVDISPAKHHDYAAPGELIRQRAQTSHSDARCAFDALTGMNEDHLHRMADVGLADANCRIQDRPTDGDGD